MKPIQTPDSDVTFTLEGPDGERLPDADLPAQRIMVYDGDRGETERDAKLAFETLWMPDEHEARRLEAGAAVQIRITGKQHPPISVGVTAAVLPERELIDRGHVDRALGWIYGNLKGEINARLRARSLTDVVDADGLIPDPSAFADLWAEAVAATRPDASHDTAATDDASPVDQPESVLDDEITP